MLSKFYFFLLAILLIGSVSAVTTFYWGDPSGSTSFYNLTYDATTNDVSENRSLWFSTYNATYDGKADYSYGANNFTGTGNFTGRNVHLTGNVTAQSFVGTSVISGATSILITNICTLNTVQTISGAKTFSNTPTISNSAPQILFIDGTNFDANNDYDFGSKVNDVFAITDSTTSEDFISYYSTGKNLTLCEDGACGRILLNGNTTVSANMLFTLSANTTSVSCTSVNAGAIYYDGSQNKHRGCNSTSWNDLY